MDSPVRKMQKRNDYNRHKLFRKIRRRRRAQALLLSRIAEKELKKKLRVTPVKYDNGKTTGYVRDKNDHPIAFDAEGNLVDQVTGDKGTMYVPEVTISPSRYTRDLYSSAFDPNASVEFVNAMTAGGLNNLSPTQWARRAYDTVGLINGDMSQGLYIDSWINGNNGIVTDDFAQEHPYWSTGINMAGDALAIGTGVLSKKGIPSKITAKNATSITPEQWDAAYNQAVKTGNMAEAQRLRDLHFISKAPRTVTSVNGQPLQLYHGTNAHFNAFDLSKFGSTDAGTFGSGIYTSPSKDYARFYGKNIMPIYMKLNNPRNLRRSNYADLMSKRYTLGPDFATGDGIDGVIGSFDLDDLGRTEDLRTGFVEYVSHNPNNIKSSATITYDDTGNIIPLSKRDNFSVNDIRYGLVPTVIGLTGYRLYDDSGYKNGKTTSGIHIKPSHRGRLTALKKRTGKSEAELYRTGSAATRKMITFARNARKWNK